MKRYLMFMLLLVAAGQGMAQYVGNGIQGKLSMVQKDDEITLSPYLHNDWIKGTITLSSGETYSNLDLKFNVVSNEVEYKGEKGESMVPKDEVKEFRMGADIFRSGFRATEDLNERTFYNVLYEGKITLLKHVSRELKNEKSHNSNLISSAQVSTETYYLSRQDGTVLKIKKDKKALLEALGNQSADLEKFIAINKLTFKEDSDMALLVGFYNSL